jgi:hypothetical protein
MRVSLLAAVATTLAALTAHAAGTIRVAANAEIRGTNPGVNRDANTDTVMLHIIEGLVGYKDDGTPAPLLAQSIDVSKDGKTYTFKLRPGVKFHNGAPLTSADVVWSWKRYLDPNTKWLCLSEFDGSQALKIESVEAKDPLTVVFKLNQARPLFLTQIASFQCGSGGIIHKDSVNADGSWKAPIGTGPFKLGEWKRGEWIELTAFKDYKSAARPARRLRRQQDAARRFRSLDRDQGRCGAPYRAHEGTGRPHAGAQANGAHRDGESSGAAGHECSHDVRERHADPGSRPAALQPEDAPGALGRAQRAEHRHDRLGRRGHAERLDDPGAEQVPHGTAQGAAQVRPGGGEETARRGRVQGAAHQDDHEPPLSRHV